MILHQLISQVFHSFKQPGQSHIGASSSEFNSSEPVVVLLHQCTGEESGLCALRIIKLEHPEQDGLDMLHISLSFLVYCCFDKKFTISSILSFFS